MSLTMVRSARGHLVIKSRCEGSTLKRLTTGFTVWVFASALFVFSPSPPLPISVAKASTGDAYETEVLKDIPRGYWRLGVSSGSTSIDSSGNGQNGSYLGGVTLGLSGALLSSSDTAVTFDEINDDWKTVCSGRRTADSRSPKSARRSGPTSCSLISMTSLGDK